MRSPDLFIELMLIFKSRAKYIYIYTIVLPSKSWLRFYMNFADNFALFNIFPKMWNFAANLFP